MTIINMSGGKPAKPVVVEAVEDTPSTLPHTYEPRDGVDYLSSVTVGKDPNLVPGNVKQGVTIFGTEGTYEGTTTVTGDLPDYRPPRGWNNFSAVIVCDNTLRDYTTGGGGTSDEGIVIISNLNTVAWPGDTSLTSVPTANGDFSDARAVEVHLDAQILTDRNMNYNPQLGWEDGDVIDLKGYFALIGNNSLTEFNPNPPYGTTVMEGEVTITKKTLKAGWNGCDVAIPDIDRTFYTTYTSYSNYMLGFVPTYGKVRP